LQFEKPYNRFIRRVLSLDPRNLTEEEEKNEKFCFGLCRGGRGYDGLRPAGARQLDTPTKSYAFWQRVICMR
jgi:hypothetical protein